MPAMHSRIISDPVHGFISVEGETMLSLIQAPELQRLRRIRQLGVGYLVFPGAEHSRFGHALGAMALMDDAIVSLRKQGVTISDQEQVAAKAAALLHDIGHGPFSHTLESDLINDFHHEDMSRVLLVEINRRMGGKLDMALEMFDGTYPTSFFHQLVASQLDMDRLDYLRRDSYYTGVMEGTVGVDRIIKMMRVGNANDTNQSLTFNGKATYAIENFLQARRFMYWQVYLHRGVISGDYVLKSILRRVRHLSHLDKLDVRGSNALMFFIENRLSSGSVSEPRVWKTYCELDDSDILYSIKQWRSSTDKLLSNLCDRFINRNLLKVRFIPRPLSESELANYRQEVESWIVKSGLAPASTCRDCIDYYFNVGSVTHTAYTNSDGGISIVDPHGRLKELSEVATTSAVDALRQTEERHYIVVPQEIDIFID